MQYPDLVNVRHHLAEMLTAKNTDITEGANIKSIRQIEEMADTFFDSCVHLSLTNYVFPTHFRFWINALRDEYIEKADMRKLDSFMKSCKTARMGILKDKMSGNQIKGLDVT